MSNLSLQWLDTAQHLSDLILPIGEEKLFTTSTKLEMCWRRRSTDSKVALETNPNCIIIAITTLQPAT